MLTTPAFIRAASGLASAFVHAFVFVAASHATHSSAGTESAALELLLIDVPPDPLPEASERSMAVASVRAAAFVPPPTHTHSYPVPLDHDAHPHNPSFVHPPISLARPTEPISIAAAPLSPAKFAMIVKSSSQDIIASASKATEPTGTPEYVADAAPFSEDNVSSPAQLTQPISPAYPAEARAQEIEADVVLSILVTATGRVADAQVVKAAGFGFDDVALRAVRAARFVPANRDGQRVPVRMRWLVSFRLR